MFLWERFKTLGAKPAEFDAVEMEEIEDNDGVVRLVSYKPLNLRDGPNRSNTRIRVLSNISNYKNTLLSVYSIHSLRNRRC